MTNHRWTDGDRDFVRANYTGHRASCEHIAATLHVSWLAVRAQVQKLGIARIVRKYWRPEEDERLGRLIHQYRPEVVARMMHRGLNSVVLRAKRLHYSRRVRDGWFTKKEVCEILGEDHHWVQHRIDSGALKASYHYGHRPGKKGGAAWHIDERDLREFIIKYPDELTGRNVDMVILMDIVLNGKDKW